MRKMGTFGSYKCPGFALEAGGTSRRKAFLSSSRRQPCLARSSKQAIVIVDHGSRRAESNKQLEDFVTLYRSPHLFHANLLQEQAVCVLACLACLKPSSGSGSTDKRKMTYSVKSRSWSA